MSSNSAHVRTAFLCDDQPVLFAAMEVYGFALRQELAGQPYDQLVRLACEQYGVIVLACQIDGQVSDMVSSAGT